MVEYPMSFEENEIQVKQQICDPESIISYDETVLDEEEVVWIASLTATKAPDFDELTEMVLEEYHKFIALFGEA
jgi:hypothetical protein